MQQTIVLTVERFLETFSESSDDPKTKTACVAVKDGKELLSAVNKEAVAGKTTFKLDVPQGMKADYRDRIRIIQGMDLATGLLMARADIGWVEE